MRFSQLRLLTQQQALDLVPRDNASKNNCAATRNSEVTQCGRVALRRERQIWLPEQNRRANLSLGRLREVHEHSSGFHHSL